MREILFRGKTEKGEWVQGDLLNPDLYGNGYAIRQKQRGFYHSPDVIPETVGQYTGLTDKNGKKIFEGDIVKYKQTDAAKRNNKTIICIGKVIYNTKTASFAVESKDKEGIKYFDYFPIKSCENIGNIHDNPELLERSDSND